jgi:hypothetical protein
MIKTIRAIIRLNRIDRMLKHLDKAVRLAEKAGLQDRVAFQIDRVKIQVALDATRISDDAKEHNKGIAA